MSPGTVGAYHAPGLCTSCSEAQLLSPGRGAAPTLPPWVLPVPVSFAGNSACGLSEWGGLIRTLSSPEHNCRPSERNWAGPGSGGEGRAPEHSQGTQSNQLSVTVRDRVTARATGHDDTLCWKTLGGLSRSLSACFDCAGRSHLSYADPFSLSYSLRSFCMDPNNAW